MLQKLKSLLASKLVLPCKNFAKTNKQLVYIRQKIASHLQVLLTLIRLHPRRTSGSLILLACIVALALIVWPRQVAFAFDKPEVCVKKLVLLPKLHKPSRDASYDVNFASQVSVGGFDILARQVCTAPSTMPNENADATVSFSIFGNRLLRHSLKVSTTELPQAGVEKLQKPISAKEPLELALDKHDAVFEYEASANERSAKCQKNALELKCPIDELGLKQGRHYVLTFSRRFKSETAATVFAGKVFTAEPVKIVKTTADGGVIYKKLSKLVLKANKPLASYDGLSLHKISKEGEAEVPITVTVEGDSLEISASQPLQRRADFRLRLNDIYAADNGQLDKPLDLKFSTSGGPAVKGVNIGSYAVDIGRQIWITFDQPLSDKNITAQISLRTGSAKAKFSVGTSGKSLIIYPTQQPRCTTYTIRLSDDIQSKYGIGGDSGWEYSFRTRCAAISTIGYSVAGRPILAYRFGTGASKILFVGTMHGNERSGYYTLNSWVDELERNPSRIPSKRSVLVVPNSNPDGFYANRRTNLNNVDLNRNFPADDWQKDVYMPGPTYSPKGGGSKPLSEPESAALASYVSANSPRLVLTYHSTAAVVIANGSGDSSSLAHTYAGKAGYSVASDSQSDGVFGYPTTGEFEDWLHDKLGIPALLVELGTMSGNSFSRNQAAMWAMVGI